MPHLVEIKVVFHDCKKAFVPFYLFLHFLLQVRFLSCNILLLTNSHKYLKPFYLFVLISVLFIYFFPKVDVMSLFHHPILLSPKLQNFSFSSHLYNYKLTFSLLDKLWKLTNPSLIIRIIWFQNPSRKVHHSNPNNDKRKNS